MSLIDHINELSESLVKLDEKIGFRRLLGYACVVLVIIALFNFKSVVRGVVEIVAEVNEQIHDDGMIKRDELLFELSPILQEFRVTAGADRILYFEYHNSKENLVGIPFKYVDLILQNQKYGISPIPEATMCDINVGSIATLYEVIKMGEIVYCSGPEDEYFKTSYPGAFEIFENSDGSKQQVFISIPGVRQPIGMIVLEWMGEDRAIDQRNIADISYTGSNSFIPRINGLIMSKTNK